MTNFDAINNGFIDPEDDSDSYNEPEEEFEDTEGKVGYCNPPKHTQFKKGVSGNPKGRPKPPENMSDALAKEFSCYIEIKENGKIKRVKAMEAVAKRILTEALKGNSAILRKILDSKMLDQNLLKMAFNNYNHDYKKDVKPLTGPEKKVVAFLKTWIDEKTMEEQRKEREKREQGL